MYQDRIATRRIMYISDGRFPLNYFLARIFSLPCQAEEVSWSVGGGKDWEKEAAGGGKTETDDGWVQ